jgi:hypothetical protein
MPSTHRPLHSGLEPRPLPLPLRDDSVSTGAYGDGQRATSSIFYRAHQHQQREIRSASTAATMASSMSNMQGQSAVTDTMSHYFQPTRFRALPQNQQFLTSSTFPSSGFSQILNGTSSIRDIAAPSTGQGPLSEYSFPSLEQQQMLSSIIGHSRVTCTDGSGVPPGRSSSLESDLNTYSAFANASSSDMNPIESGNALPSLFHKQEQQQHIPQQHQHLQERGSSEAPESHSQQQMPRRKGI